MIQKIPSKVPRSRRPFPQRPQLSAAEIARREAELEKFSQQCQVIFDRIYPELVPEHYDRSITIEPISGDYFIDPDPEVAFQQAKQKHPTAIIMEMRLNETGTCGRI